jgi:hypothetical protein
MHPTLWLAALLAYPFIAAAVGCFAADGGLSPGRQIARGLLWPAVLAACVFRELCHIARGE